MAAADVPIFHQDDITPNIYVAPPLSCLSQADFSEKLPPVQNILSVYSKTDSSNGSSKVTAWMHGLLYSLSNSALEYLTEDADIAEVVCNSAETLLRHFGSSIDPIQGNYPGGEPYWKRNRNLFQAIMGRRIPKRCDVSRKNGPVWPTDFFPEHSGCSRGNGACKLLDRFECIVNVLLHAQVAECVVHGFPTSHPWSSALYLSPYLGQLFDDGFLGLRPLVIRRGCEMAGNLTMSSADPCLLYFSVHWMPRNTLDPNSSVRCPPGLPEIDRMLERDGWANEDSLRCEMDALTGQPITDGNERFIECHSYEYAKFMFTSLAFHWSITLASCLAGSLGMNELDAKPAIPPQSHEATPTTTPTSTPTLTRLSNEAPAAAKPEIISQ